MHSKFWQEVFAICNTFSLLPIKGIFYLGHFITSLIHFLSLGINFLGIALNCAYEHVNHYSENIGMLLDDQRKAINLCPHKKLAEVITENKYNSQEEETKTSKKKRKCLAFNRIL